MSSQPHYGGKPYTVEWDDPKARRQQGKDFSNAREAISFAWSQVTANMSNVSVWDRRTGKCLRDYAA